MARVSASFVFQKLEKMVLCPEPPPKLKLPECNIIELTDDDKHDSPKLEKRTRMHHIGRHRSCVVPLSDNELNDLQHRCLLQTLEVSKSPGGGSQCSPHEETPTDAIASHRNAIADAAWEALKRSIVYFRGEPIGTVAAIDKSQGAALNYDQVFMRDFIPSALAFLMNGEHFIVKNFLVETARLQSREKMVDLFKLGQGVMPASFKGIYGYPIEIQALFFMAMRCALSLLKQDSDADFVNHITKRIQALSYHLHSYYWLDFQRLNDIYCYKTEEYSQTALNKFNVIPESIPDWIFDFMPSRGGYFIGNVGPARMDFRWFCLGNFIAILSSLATGEQAEAILDLVEERWEELIGEMPLKICYPAMENQEWQIVTGCDPKNTRWSYHNGGSWPGTNYWAEIHHCLRGMNLIINLSLSDKCGAPIALMCTDGRYTRECRMGIPMQACLRAHYHNHPPKTIACFTEAASTSQIAHKHPDSFQSSFWKNLVQGYNKFHSGNSLDIRSIFQRAMAGAPLVLMISLSFSGAVDANPALLSDDGSITSIMSAFLCGDVFSKTVQKLAKEPSEENGPNNTASISLDDLDEFISSYLKGIGRLRWWCETYGIRVDLSKIFGSHIVVFTTPPAGTFFFPVKYNGRVITFSLYGRNLYLMGWRTPKGTFELKGKSCHRKNYMSGNVTILPAKKNYRFHAPAGNVGNVRLGLLALRESFEVLYKSNAGTSDVYQAMVTFAVHLAEAARIQSILKDVHDISLESSMGTLDSRRNNSLWVNKYGVYSRVELRRINQHLGYEADSEDCDDGVLSEGEMSEVETLQQIRVFPRDVTYSGVFEHKPVPEDHPTEDDSYLEDKRCSERSKRKVKYTKSKKASLGGEGSTLPFYLLEDWFLDRDQDSDDEKQEEEEEIDQEENEKPMSNEKVREVQMTAAEREEFLNQFPLVKKLVTRQTQEHQDYCCQSQIIEDIRMTGLRLNDKMPYPYVSCAAISSPHMQIELGGAIGRKILKPTHPAPSSVLLRGARVFSRFFRFAL